MRTFIILFIFINFSIQAQIQENQVLSLEDCIRLAETNNIDLKRSGIQSETEKLTFRSTKSRVLPDLNASYSYAVNKGRSIDPYTNDVIDQQFSYSNAGIRLNAQLFNGFELRNSIQRDRYNMQAAEAEKQAARQQLVLDVTLAYFQVLNAQDLLKLAKLRLESTRGQQDRISSLADEGSGNPADLSDIQGQFKNDESAVLTAENQLQQAHLDLRLLLNIETDFEIRELPLQPEMNSYELSAEELYQQSLENLEVFEARKLRLEAAREDVAVARSLYVPELSFFAQLNTNYSSLASLLNETGTQVVETGQFLNINGTTYAVQTNQSQFSQQDIPYVDQLNNNLSSVAGLSFSIPIFNGFRAKRQVSLKKLQLEDARLELENTKNEYRRAIEAAYNDMDLAYQDYFLLQEQVKAYAESFRVNEIRFQNGVSNLVAYIISKNNLDRARVNMANAKYEFLIRRQVLDYYRGSY
ncbi:TolC family protein [Christiangramia flava]|uniref:Outer membrane efflux protein n=1 Tax=Christiangramia flava JLT2011 TaxID=1229726 RepID=A0A1L7I0F6_9FLAO|nr:TolC family protein [Christiangramia flava]APU67079.1 Outer membrane efflux protein [Christiangramia flava JLT2011]OSS38752.1 Outer membrane efflux protein [Christiangramia flava JLT2011]